MHHKTKISSQWYKTAQPVFTVKLRNPFENIIFHILCYIFDSNNLYYSHTTLFEWHQLRRLFKREKGIPASSRLKKNNKILVRNIYYSKFDLSHSLICSQRTRLRCLWKIKKAPESTELEFAEGSATYHRYSVRLCGKKKSIHDQILGLNTQINTEYSNCLVCFQKRFFSKYDIHICPSRNICACQFMLHFYTNNCPCHWRSRSDWIVIQFNTTKIKKCAGWDHR